MFTKQDGRLTFQTVFSKLFV